LPDLDKIQPNCQLDNSSEKSEQGIQLELDNIEKKLNNPKLCQPHETGEYLRKQKLLLIEKQKLEAEKKEAQEKAGY